MFLSFVLRKVFSKIIFQKYFPKTKEIDYNFRCSKTPSQLSMVLKSLGRRLSHAPSCAQTTHSSVWHNVSGSVCCSSVLSVHWMPASLRPADVGPTHLTSRSEGGASLAGEWPLWAQLLHLKKKDSRMERVWRVCVLLLLMFSPSKLDNLRVETIYSIYTF